MKSIDSLHQSIPLLPLIEHEQLTDFRAASALIQANILRDLPASLSQITAESLEFIQCNHLECLQIIAFFQNSPQLLNVLPTSYARYYSQTFSVKDLQILTPLWHQAIQITLSSESANQITTCLNWMLEHHLPLLTLAENQQKMALIASGNNYPQRQAFQRALLTGNSLKAKEIMTAFIQTPDDLAPFFQDIIQPSLYHIGNLWEKGQISVAQEHLATAISTRVMTMATQRVPAPISRNKASALVTTVPLENHDLGAWMFSDLLEQAGWQVRFLGGNTPTDDILRDLLAFPRDLLAISMTRFSSMDQLKMLLTKVRTTPALKSLKILLGGQAFQAETAEKLEIDGYASSASEGIQLARQWQLENEPFI